MKWLTFKIRREPGFRFNLIDLIAILCAGAVSLIAYEPFRAHGLFLVPLYLIVSFFLFCNVFRIGNKLEAFWYLTFTTIFLLVHDQPKIYWHLTLGICEPLKAGLILFRIRRGPYRGAFYKQLSRYLAGSVEFLESLTPKQAQKVTWVLKLIEELPSAPSNYLKKLVNTDDIREVRVAVGNNIFRLLGFFDGPQLIVFNHAFQKKTQKTPPQAIKIAEDRKKEYFERRK